MNICKCCSTEFIPKGLSKKNAHKQRFCSRSCSNSIIPRRKKKISLCVYCKQPVSYYLNKHCDDCKLQGRHRFYRKHKSKLLSEITIKEYLRTARGGANRYDSIRGHARTIFNNSNQPKKCYNCGYDKHIEICHVKAISEFKLDTTIDKVNAENNLVALCPNCHWEFDNNILKLKK